MKLQLSMVIFFSLLTLAVTQTGCGPTYYVRADHGDIDPEQLEQDGVACEVAAGQAGYTGGPPWNRFYGRCLKSKGWRALN